MRRRYLWVVLIPMMACGTDSLPTEADPSGCPPDSVVTWESFAEPLMLSYCTGCHSSALPEGLRAGAPIGVDFDSHEKTLDWLERIAARSAGSNKSMPPVDTLSAVDRERLAEWIACGAP